MVVTALFCLLLFVAVYPYFLYPPLVYLLARWFGRPVLPVAWEPRVSLVLAALNEEAVIGRKLENALALDYPKDKLEVLVGSDGSTDRTVAIARSFAARGVTVKDFTERRGKASVVADLVAASTGEVLVLTDASAMVEPDAVRRLTALLGSPGVGAVSGQMVPWHGEGVASTLDAYRRIDNFLRRHESRLHSSMGAAGAFYGLHRALFVPPPRDIILDDFVIPMRTVEQGRRLIVSDDIPVAEIEATTIGGEFRRKVRTLAGNYQAMGWLWRLLLPGVSPVWFELVSHKLLRLVTPYCLLGLLACNVVLVLRGAGPVFQVLLGGQVLFYLLALLGFLARGRRLPIKALHYPYLFLVLQAACLVSAWHYASGRASNLWNRPDAPADGGQGGM